MPGEIVSFDASKQTAQVKPLLADQILDTSGASRALPQPVLNEVPIVFAGGGGFAETWPVAAGDPCLLVFSDRSLDLWFARGGAVAPDDARSHDITDAVAILGARSKPGALTDFDTARAVWGNKGPRIAADGTLLHLGVSHNQSATESAVLGSTFMSALSTFLDSLNAAATAIASGLTTQAGALNVLAPGLGAGDTAAALAVTQISTAANALKAQIPNSTSQKVKLV